MEKKSKVQEVAERFADRVRRADKAALADLAAEYGKANGFLAAQYKKVRAKIAEAREQGEGYSPAWDFQEARYRSLMKQVEGEIIRLGRLSYKAAARAGAEGIKAGAEAAYKQLTLGMGVPSKPPAVNVSFMRLDKQAVEAITGIFSLSSPVRNTDLLFKKADETYREVRSIMATGVIAGLPIDVTTREIKRILGASFADAARLVRTERFRAYRMSTQKTFSRNGSIVRGWRWLAYLKSNASGYRTCPVCIAMNGREFPAGEPMETHPNCRCTQVAILPTWEELGGVSGETDTRVKPIDGEAWFRSQPESYRLDILGPRKYAAWAAGEIALIDLVKVTRSPEWGKSLSVAGLALALEQARRRKAQGGPSAAL